MKAVYLICRHFTHYMELVMSRVEYLFDLEVQSTKSRLLRPAQQHTLRRFYWWVRLKYLTVKWWYRNNRTRNRTKLVTR